MGSLRRSQSQSCWKFFGEWTWFIYGRPVVPPKGKLTPLRIGVIARCHSNTEQSFKIFLNAARMCSIFLFSADNVFGDESFHGWRL